MRSAASRCASVITCPVRPARQDGCQTARYANVAPGSRTAISICTGKALSSTYKKWPKYNAPGRPAAARSSARYRFPCSDHPRLSALPCRKMFGPNLPPDRCRIKCPRSTGNPRSTAIGKPRCKKHLGDGRPWGNRPRRHCPVLLRQTFRAGEIEPAHCAGLFELVQGAAALVLGLVPFSGGIREDGSRVLRPGGRSTDARSAP